MIITRTPLRITFVGGGTDLPDFYSKHGGSVVSAAINKYIYIIVNKKFDSKIRVSYSKTEIVDSVDEIRHPTVREALKLLDLDGGIEILSISDVPSQGTGLGSSSSFLVGLLNALHAYRSEYVSNETLAKEAVKIEREILKEAGGKQDQYMAAYGGIDLLQFLQNGEVRVNPIPLKTERLQYLKENTILLYTGVERSSTEIHTDQISRIEEHTEEYLEMKKLAEEFAVKLYSSSIEELGDIMDRNWVLKKRLSSKISNDVIDRLYSRARDLGAYGGKLIGAGGGGFLLFFIDREKRDRLKELGLRQIDYDFDFEGSRIIYYQDR
ncbi:kinase [Thermoplasma sp. Kam2015]|uniref:GHMP family kinase ATP-binding protein n=1 Tax=Thermoplasma sp. Kam2015 TaxID=2094122 RepID=UPI000D898A41|nr:kinase [Thermoplasma sp. Kam2015]PYB68647.1 kinase [Thermoplasma sp. Kam2015]